MKQALTLLLAGGAIGLASAVFAGAAPFGAHGFVFEGPATGTDVQLLRVSGDDDDGKENDGWLGWASGQGESDDDDDDCEEDDEGGCTAGGAGNAAPAGTVAPPKNGLFTNGTAPQVKSN